MSLATEPVEWAKALAPVGAAVVQLAAAAAVAYFGFRYGIRKTREERGFDRRMAWYDETLTAVRALREVVTYAASVETRRAGPVVAAGGLAAQTAALGEAESAWRLARERAATLFALLEQAVTRADVESEAAAATALVRLRSIASHFSPNAQLVSSDGTSTHAYHLTPQGKPSGLLPTVLLDLRAVEQAAIAGARTALGYPPRLPELVPNAKGVIEIPPPDTKRTQGVRKLLWRRRL